MYGENTIAAICSVIGALWPPLWVPPKLACRDCRDCHQPTSTAHFLAPVVDARPSVAPHADADVHLKTARATAPSSSRRARRGPSPSRRTSSTRATRSARRRARACSATATRTTGRRAAPRRSDSRRWCRRCAGTASSPPSGTSSSNGSGPRRSCAGRGRSTTRSGARVGSGPTSESTSTAIRASRRRAAAAPRSPARAPAPPEAKSRSLAHSLVLRPGPCTGAGAQVRLEPCGG